MDMKRIRRLRERLEARRAALSALRARNVNGESELLAEKEPDPLDTAAERSAAGALASLAESERDGLLRIESALARMDVGTYGLCRECGGRIEDARLDAVPEALLCLECGDGARPAL